MANTSSIAPGSAIQSQFKMYLPWPDLLSTASITPYWGVHNGGQWNDYTWATDPYYVFLPGNVRAGYLKDWASQTAINTLLLVQPNYHSPYLVQSLLSVDPRIAATDYTVQPRQYLQQSSSATACSSFGWPCPVTLRNDVVYSRTAWSTGSAANLAGGHTFYQSRATYNDYDFPAQGQMLYYQMGQLLDIDQAGGPDGALDLTV